MAKKIVEGHCHVCGSYGPLSEEHVPPKRAYNDMPYVTLDFGQTIRLGPEDVPEGPKRQGGVRFHTLCRNCNNWFGGWYARAFIDWCYQGMYILERSGGNPRLVYAHNIYPMKVLKQIVAMFFSVNSPLFRESPIGSELARLLLNPDEKGLPPDARFYALFNIAGQVRYNSTSALLRVNEGVGYVFSEITYPPFGYVMCLDSKPPDSRLFDITHFAYADFNETRTEFIDLPVLPTYLATSGDYRTLEEIGKGVAESRSLMEGHSAWLLHDDGAGKPFKPR
jgi:hypothetical protein